MFFLSALFLDQPKLKRIENRKLIIEQESTNIVLHDFESKLYKGHLIWSVVLQKMGGTVLCLRHGNTKTMLICSRVRVTIFVIA